MLPGLSLSGVRSWRAVSVQSALAIKHCFAVHESIFRLTPHAACIWTLELTTLMHAAIRRHSDLAVRPMGYTGIPAYLGIPSVRVANRTQFLHW